MTEQKPSIGRIVHFRIHENDVEKAAIVTGIWTDTEVYLTAFPAGGSPQVWGEPVQHSSKVEGYSQPRWDWPPRV